MQQEITQDRFPEAPSQPARASLDMLSWLRVRITLTNAALCAIAAASLFLGLINIGQNGYGNAYYAAAVRSMLQNWHAFFFASYDANGFVTVDKPPAGLWIQTASAWLFGYHGWSIMLPQALAAAGSVLLVFHLTRRSFGRAAGLLAALALAIAPVNVAVARNNTSDGLLVFVLLLGAVCVMRAARTGQLVWLAAAMAFIGIGFNIKMMEAYLVLPAFIAVYLLSTQARFWCRVGQLAIAGAVLLVVSFSWATVVALTPASERPYIGSTQNNSIFSLIFGYNGINRLLPRGWSIFGITNSSAATGGFAGGGVGGSSENGAQGIFRLLNVQLAGQIGWLIPLAAVGVLVAWGRPRFRKLTEPQLLLVLFGGWAAVEIAFFSVAGFYHRYYLSTLSPAIAVLAGAGLVALWQLFRAGGWRSIWLPAAVALAAASQYRILGDYPVWKSRLEPVLIGGVGAAVAGLLIVTAFSRWDRLRSGRFIAGMRLLAVAGALTLFVAPSVWSYTTTTEIMNGTMPAAGPASTTTGRGRGGFGAGSAPAGGARFAQGFGPGVSATTNDGLIAYLKTNKGNADYLLAVSSSQQADQIIISTGEPVMAMGGFSGGDPILTVASLKNLIAASKVRFFMTSGRGGFGGQRGSQTTGESVTQWIAQSCTVVPSSAIGGTGAGSSRSGSGLYDCQGAASKP